MVLLGKSSYVSDPEKRDSLTEIKKPAGGAFENCFKKKGKSNEENVSGSHLFICTEQY